MEELTKEEIWELAESLNKIDGLPPSEYLKNLIIEEENDKINTQEIIKKLKEYYKNEEKNNR